MKVLFASDIHGDLCAATKVRDTLIREGAERLYLLGDLLYHGPRNHLPEGYDPKGVIALLSDLKDCITAVRGTRRSFPREQRRSSKSFLATSR